MFIEIVTNLFESMDVLLGLPDDIRMSKRHGSQHGLLSVPGMIEITRLVLNQAHTPRGDIQNNWVRVLRRDLAALRRLLRDSFSP